MSECPEYYRVSDGREFWEFFRETCSPINNEYCLFDNSQMHALESACEYLFRAGVKTVDPRDDIRKAFRLIDRAMSMATSDAMKKQAEGLVSEVVGRVMLERARKHMQPKADPIITAWGKIDNG